MALCRLQGSRLGRNRPAVCLSAAAFPFGNDQMVTGAEVDTVRVAVEIRLVVLYEYNYTSNEKFTRIHKPLTGHDGDGQSHPSGCLRDWMV
jgi:hypothetical protein